MSENEEYVPLIWHMFDIDLQTNTNNMQWEHCDVGDLAIARGWDVQAMPFGVPAFHDFSFASAGSRLIRSHRLDQSALDDRPIRPMQCKGNDSDVLHRPILPSHLSLLARHRLRRRK
jgi:hypothetical protein